jgi:hypothetical protein
MCEFTFHFYVGIVMNFLCWMAISILQRSVLFLLHLSTQFYGHKFHYNNYQFLFKVAVNFFVRKNV